MELFDGFEGARIGVSWPRMEALLNSNDDVAEEASLEARKAGSMTVMIGYVLCVVAHAVDLYSADDEETREGAWAKRIM